MFTFQFIINTLFLCVLDMICLAIAACRSCVFWVCEAIYIVNAAAVLIRARAR